MRPGTSHRRNDRTVVRSTRERNPENEIAKEKDSKRKGCTGKLIQTMKIKNKSRAEELLQTGLGGID